MQVCTTRDLYIQNFYENNPMWVVQLSNGVTVYQDDGRPEVTGSAWLRLKEYCESNQLYIERFEFGFRSNKFVANNDTEGHLFKFGVSCVWGGKTVQQFIIGTVKDGIVHYQKYRTPEMILESSGTRPLSQDDAECIIWKKNTNHCLER